MNKKSNIMKPVYIICIFASLMLSFSLQAQQTDTSNKAFSETVDVVRPYQPKITDAVKLDVVPSGEKLEIQKPQITYTAKAKQFQVQTTNTNKLPAINFTKSPRKDFDHFFIKAGAGNYMNILFDANYNSTMLPDRSLSVRLLNQSGKSTFKYSNYGEQLADITGRMEFGNKSLSGNIFVKNNRYHFFGYSPADSVNADTIDPLKIRQNFLVEGFKASFNNELTPKEKIRYWTSLDVYNLNDFYKKNELGLGFYGKIEQYFSDNPIRFEALIHHYLHYNANTPNSHRTYFNVQAEYIFIRDNWRAEIGFAAPTESDTLVAKTHFYPKILLEASLVESYFNIFGGLTGNLTENTYFSIAEENPYTVPYYELRNSNNKFEIFAGAKGSISSKFRYLFRFSYHNLENVLLFVNDTISANNFLPVYDSSNTNLTKIHFEATFNPISNLSFFASFNYNQYDQNPPEPKPWHIPAFESKFSAQYCIQKKIYFNLDYFFFSKRYAKNWDDLTNPIELKPINDLNLGISYKFSDRWAIFFQFNNLLNDKYSYWNNYELRGFHFLAGGKVNF
ncbi:MAG: TonB-dependent receptor [Sphingobacteriales bacterium]|nr:TonB-dependent receptor [Sphingobacteriales bacterium]HPD64599.1 hypothetical protein [Bacteroidia bacterium]